MWGYVHVCGYVCVCEGGGGGLLGSKEMRNCEW